MTVPEYISGESLKGEIFSSVVAAFGQVEDPRDGLLSLMCSEAVNATSMTLSFSGN